MNYCGLFALSHYLVNLFIALFSTSNAPCLEEVQQRKNSYLKIFQNKLPGKIITGDKQCKQQYGKGYRHCKQKQVNK